jgi:hypothetical protein
MIHETMETRVTVTVDNMLETTPKKGPQENDVIAYQPSETVA